MAIELDMAAPGFDERFAALIGAKREQAADVDAAVAAIIEDVRSRGDAALADFSLRFDRVDVASLGVAIGAVVLHVAGLTHPDSAAVTVGDFHIAFVAVGLIGLAGVFEFRRLPPHAGEVLR